MKKFFIDTFLSILSIGYPILYLIDLQESHIFSYWLYAMITIWLCKAINTKDKNTKLFSFIISIILLLILLNKKSDLMYFYPIFINSIMLTVFGLSLFQKQSAIEKIARLTTPELPPKGVIYTRKVTQVWVIFFSLNIIISLICIQLKEFNLWAIYNGFISYILMGLLFIIEYFIRQRVNKK